MKNKVLLDTNTVREQCPFCHRLVQFPQPMLVLGRDPRKTDRNISVYHLDCWNGKSLPGPTPIG